MYIKFKIFVSFYITKKKKGKKCTETQWTRMKSSKRTNPLRWKKSDCAIRVKFIVKQSHFAQQNIQQGFFFRHARMLSITHIDPFFPIPFFFSNRQSLQDDCLISIFYLRKILYLQLKIEYTFENNFQEDSKSLKSTRWF